ncbi:MAG: hypothetical protein C0436_02640 [Alphaproteobacteria bacterium]|nr:hypothetical protein [Alphaproteobacteria bacterium]
MQHRTLEHWQETSAAVAARITTLSASIPLDAIDTPSTNRFQSHSHQQYLALCSTLGVHRPPTLIVIEDRQYRKYYECGGARYISPDNIIVMQRKLWSAYRNGDPEGVYAITHELGHAFQRQNPSAPSRRSVVAGLISSALVPTTTISGAVIGIRTGETLHSLIDEEATPSLTNPSSLVGAALGTVAGGTLGNKTLTYLRHRSHSSEVRASERFVDRFATQHLGHHETIRGLLDFVSDTLKVSRSNFEKTASDTSKRLLRAQSYDLRAEYRFLTQREAESIVLLRYCVEESSSKRRIIDQLSTDHMRNGDYPSVYDRITQILADEKNSQRTR